MKRIILLALVLMFAVTGSVYAYPVSTGDYVSLRYSNGTADPNGHFDVYSAVAGTDDSTIYSTFCLQKTTYFSLSGKYYATIDDDIIGFGGDSTEYTHQDLADGTKFLFWNYSQGTLAGYDGSSSADVIALQNAIWNLQGYGVDVSGNEFSALIAEMGSIDTTGMDVKVMNLWDSFSVESGVYDGPHQSQLIANAPVPEPATMVLLGSGLVGLAFYRRKMKK